MKYHVLYEAGKRSDFWVALRLAKSAVNEGLRMDLEAGLQYEHKCFSLLFATEDQKEGMRAFSENVHRNSWEDRVTKTKGDGI
ncbi:hypothetical protein JCM17380_39690 [Desulfosporosinus burensis]